MQGRRKFSQIKLIDKSVNFEPCRTESNPNLEFKMLLEYLQTEPRELIFQMHPDTNMPCLMQPILFCLNRSKGTSRQVRIAGLT